MPKQGHWRHASLIRRSRPAIPQHGTDIGTLAVKTAKDGVVVLTAAARQDELAKMIAMSRWQRTRFAWQSWRSVVRAGLLPRNRSADRGWVILGESFSASGPPINVAPCYRVQRTTGISELVWLLWRPRPNEVRTVTRDGSATSFVSARFRIGDCPSRLLPWRSSVRSGFRTR